MISNRFAITFLNGMEILESRHDIPRKTAVFQIQPRFDEKLIVLNTCIDGRWGREQRSPGFPLSVGAVNEVKIVCESNCYQARKYTIHTSNLYTICIA